jgi:hypothetical protein
MPIMLRHLFQGLRHVSFASNGCKWCHQNKSLEASSYRQQHLGTAAHSKHSATTTSSNMWAQQHTKQGKPHQPAGQSAATTEHGNTDALLAPQTKKS